jgi:hypothetical protein
MKILWRGGGAWPLLAPTKLHHYERVTKCQKFRTSADRDISNGKKREFFLIKLCFPIQIYIKSELRLISRPCLCFYGALLQQLRVITPFYLVIFFEVFLFGFYWVSIVFRLLNNHVILKTKKPCIFMCVSGKMHFRKKIKLLIRFGENKLTS